MARGTLEDRFGVACPALSIPDIQDIFAALRIEAHFQASGGCGQARTTRLAVSGGPGRGEQASAVDLYDAEKYAGSRNYYTPKRPLTAENKLGPPVS